MIVDAVLIGTGLAPLIAARVLESQGKTVALLNPDHDFFLEDVEFPIETSLSSSSIGLSPEKILDILRPEFPGAVEWMSLGESQMETPDGFRDSQAPFVRSRSRIYLESLDVEGHEDLFLQLSERGLKPAEIAGLAALKRFPGFSGKGSEKGEGAWRGVAVKHLTDVDVIRYRNGLLEFVRERLGQTSGHSAIVTGASQIEISDGTVRFLIPEGEEWVSRTLEVKQSIQVFWTPRLTHWITQSFEGQKVPEVSLWEQWSLISREPLSPGAVGVLTSPRLASPLWVWPQLEGSQVQSHELNVLRRTTEKSGWLSRKAFEDLRDLCLDFLQWDKYSIRSYRTRKCFLSEFEKRAVSLKSKSKKIKIEIYLGMEGPVHEVVARAKRAAESML